MSGGMFGGLPSFAQDDGTGLSPGLLDYLRMQGQQQGQADPQAVTLPMISADVPPATPPGFTGYDPATPPTGAPTGVVQPGGMSLAQAAMGALGPGSAQAGEMPQGASGGYAGRVFGVESGGDNYAKNPRSSATGAGQFINSTWLDQVRKNRPDLAGLPDAQILALRSDPDLSRQMVEAYGNENGAKLRAAGLPDNDGTRYLSHFLGSGGARSVLSADPSAPIGQVLQPGQISANPHIRNMTAGGVADWAARKMAGGGGGGSSAPLMTPGASDPLGMSAGATAQRGGFGLSGIQAQGGAVPGQASASPALASLSGQPMTAGAAPGGFSTDPAGAQQQASPYGQLTNLLQGVQALQKQGQGGGAGFYDPKPTAPGGSVPSIAQAKKLFDPSRFYSLLPRSRGLAR